MANTPSPRPSASAPLRVTIVDVAIPFWRLAWLLVQATAIGCVLAYGLWTVATVIDHLARP